MKLEEYALSPEGGFLSDFEIDDIEMPSLLDKVEAAALYLPDYLSSGRVRHWLDQLPDPDLTEFAVDAPENQVRKAMVRYSFLVQAYVWGEAKVPLYLPSNLALPIVALAARLEQAPLLPYSSYVLDNWARLDKSGPIALDNIRMVQNFIGGDDENWFVMIHVAIEAAAGHILDLAAQLVDAALREDSAKSEKLLVSMATHWDSVNAIFDRMPERCDPYVYFHRVRPYIHGWANNPALGEGLIYDGVEKFGNRPQAFRGQTGSQSSIVPTMDALFGVVHQSDPLRQYLDELHSYRPVQHRRFIDDMRSQSGLRQFVVDTNDSALKDVFNANIEQVSRFRTRHLEYAASYINKQASAESGNDPDVGTGGTPFMRYLKKHRDENLAHRIA